MCSSRECGLAARANLRPADSDNPSQSAGQQYLSPASSCGTARAARLSKRRAVRPSHLTALYAARQPSAQAALQAAPRAAGQTVPQAAGQTAAQATAARGHLAGQQHLSPASGCRAARAARLSKRRAVRPSRLTALCSARQAAAQQCICEKRSA